MAEFWDDVVAGPTWRPHVASQTPRAPRGKGADLNAFNSSLRENPEYRSFLQSLGVNPNGQIKLNSAQRTAAEQWVRSRFPDVGNKLQVDPAGNLNTDHGLSTAWSNPYFRYPLIIGGALATGGALGVGPMAGLFGGAAPGAAGTVAGGSGLLASYGPSQAVLAAGMTAPTASMVAPTLAGTMASYGATPAMMAAGSTLPMASVASPASAGIPAYGAQYLDMITPGYNMNPTIPGVTNANGTGWLNTLADVAGETSGQKGTPWWKKILGGLGRGLGEYGMDIADAGLQLASAKIAADAARDAARMQADSVQKALDFDTARYEEGKRNYAPYLAAGTNSLNTLQGLMSGPPVDHTNAMTTLAQTPTPQNRTVMMRAPTGETRAVPVGLVAGFQARGAEVVN